MTNDNIYGTDYDPFLGHVQPRPARPASALDGLVCPPVCVQCAPETEIEALPPSQPSCLDDAAHEQRKPTCASVPHRTADQIPSEPS